MSLKSKTRMEGMLSKERKALWGLERKENLASIFFWRNAAILYVKKLRWKIQKEKSNINCQTFLLKCKGKYVPTLPRENKTEGKDRQLVRLMGKDTMNSVILWDFLMKSDRKLTSNRIPGSLYVKVMEFWNVGI